MTALKNCRFRFLLRMAKGDTQTCQKFGGVERFGNVVVSAAVQRGDFLGFSILNRENHHWDVAPLTQAPQNFKAGEVRQTEVENNHGGLVLGREGKPLLPRGSSQHLVCIRLQSDGEQTANLRFVINDQHERFVRLAHSFSCGTGGILVSGSRIVNIAPPPSRLAAATVPSCASANPFTSDKPIPVPPGAASVPRWKRSNNRTGLPGGRPGPWSATPNTSSLDSARARTSIGVPAGVCTAALLSKLARICSVRAKSNLAGGKSEAMSTLTGCSASVRPRFCNAV